MGVEYSIGFRITDPIGGAIGKVPRAESLERSGESERQGHPRASRSQTRREPRVIRAAAQQPGLGVGRGRVRRPAARFGVQASTSPAVRASSSQGGVDVGELGREQGQLAGGGVGDERLVAPAVAFPRTPTVWAPGAVVPGA